MEPNNTTRQPETCRLDKCLKEEGYDIKRAASSLGIDRKSVESWVKGKTCPSRATMEKVACWFARSVSDIWPDQHAKTNWKQRYALLTRRLATVSYKDEPVLFSRLCSERALASVKLYSAERWTYIREMERRMRNMPQYKPPMLASEFARVTELNRKPNF
jgi:DNA-binding XRE family transcriptional regulator